MYQEKIAGYQAETPFNLYDSKLNLLTSGEPRNTQLSLTLAVKLNFVDSTNPNQKIFRTKDKYWFTKDAGGLVFQIVDWDPTERQKYANAYRDRANQFWSGKFLLYTPTTYDGLDYTWYNAGMGWRVRPNVQCMFSLALVENSPVVINLYKIAIHPDVPLPSNPDDFQADGADLFSQAPSSTKPTTSGRTR
jgi:hypothetical protein